MPHGPAFCAYLRALTQAGERLWNLPRTKENYTIEHLGTGLENPLPGWEGPVPDSVRGKRRIFEAGIRN